MSLSTNVGNAFLRASTEVKALRTLVNGNAADLSALTTTAKSNLVAAINELDAALGAAGAQINDAATNTTETWSSSKIDSEIDANVSAAVTALLDGAPGALDTLNELAAAINDDASFSASVTTALGQRVAVIAQTFTAPEQAQARTNIGAASAATLATLTSDVGDTTTNFVTVFEGGL